MKKPCHVVALAAVMIGVAGAEMRTWTDRDGRTGHEAEFVGLEGGVVRLRSVDGETLAVPLDGLSQADREFIRQRAADGPGESTVEQALASVRDVKREMFGRQSSVLGELPGPAELAAAQMLLRPIPKPGAGGPGIVEFTAEQKKHWRTKYAGKAPAEFGKSGRCGPKTLPLGITGAQVTEFLGWEHLLVAAVAGGTPAGGVLERGDIIIGANGRLFEDPEDPRPEMGYALVESQSPEYGGKLTLQIVRNGEPATVALTLGDAVPYGPTWPFDCDKSRRLRERALQVVLDADLGKEKGWTWTPLFLMASGDDRAMEQARRLIYQSVKADVEYPVEPNFSNSWVAGYRLINIAEYYLLTGDSAVLPEIQHLARVLERQQYPQGGWTHGAPGGYGQINNCGLAAFIGLILARECGVETDENELATAIRYFGKWCGTNLPYGEGAPGGRSGRMDNGMNSMSALAFHLLGEREMAERWARSVCYMWMGREKGHAEGIFSLAWGPLGAALAPKEEFHMFMNRMQWLYEMGRSSDGGYVYMRGSRKAHPGGMTPAVGLFFYLPEKRLRILGAPRGVFGTKAPEPLAAAAAAFKDKDWPAFLVAVGPHLESPEASHAEYAKGLKSAFDEMQRQAQLTLGMAEGSMRGGKRGTASAQLDAVVRLLGSGSPEIARRLRELGEPPHKDLKVERKEYHALNPKWHEGLGLEKRKGVRDGFAHSPEYIVRVNRELHRGLTAEEVARYLAHFNFGPAGAAVATLAEEGEAVTPLLVKLMGDTHPWLRAGAIDTLAKIYQFDGNKNEVRETTPELDEVVRRIGELADDPHPGVQAALAGFVDGTRLETPATRSIMVKMSASEDAGVRLKAANMCRTWLQDAETVIRIGINVSRAPDGNTPRHWQFAHMGVERFKDDPRCREAIPTMAAFLVGPSNSAPIRGFFSDSAQHVALKVMLTQWDGEVEQMPGVVTGICRSYVRTPSPPLKNYQGWHKLRLTAQELFGKFTPAAVPAIRVVVAEERKWLDEVDDDFLNLVTQLKGEEARKTTLERIAELEALADELAR